MTSLQSGARINFKNVLFLTDFSEPSSEALPFAMAIARGYGSKVYAAHVILPSTFAYMTPEAAGALLDEEEEAAKVEIGRVDAQLTGLQREILLERGSNLWEVVSRLLKEREIDLIVLGTHGRTGLKKALLGSAAEEVFRRSRVPVLMSGPDARADTHSGGRFRRVLFATDFNDVSSLAAPYAVSLAQENQAQLILLHVLPQPKPGKVAISEGLSVAEAAHQLEDLVPEEARQWCLPRAVVEHGDPAPRILAAAKGCGADLIVLGVRGMDRLANVATRTQKHIAYEVVAHARCPVLTVRG
ncbi:MAG: universal stress protein [Candidatus Acidiferrum sp.]